MNIFLVDGAVRDELLDLPVKERDWVVTGATEKEMLDRGFERLDARFPVFRHPVTGDEYALARRERKTGPGYKGFEVYAGPDVTLEEDLVRRDLTINALARDEAGRLIDLFGGLEDLDAGLLRHLSPAFTEDPVRLLRIARFAARLGRWGFRVAHGTQGLLRRMAASDDLAAINRDRLWREMKGSLAEPQPWRFFEVLKRCGALDRLLPGLASVIEAGGGHGAAGGGRGLEVLRRAAAASLEPRIRYAALAAECAAVSGSVAGLPADRDFTALTGEVVSLEPAYLASLGGDAGELLRILVDRGYAARPDALEALLTVWGIRRPDTAGRGAGLFDAARRALATVDSAGPRAQGFEGPALGAEIRRRQLAALEAVIAGD